MFRFEKIMERYVRIKFQCAGDVIRKMFQNTYCAHKRNVDSYGRHAQDTLRSECACTWKVLLSCINRN